MPFYLVLGAYDYGDGRECPRVCAASLEAKLCHPNRTHHPQYESEFTYRGL